MTLSFAVKTNQCRPKPNQCGPMRTKNGLVRIVLVLCTINHRNYGPIGVGPKIGIFAAHPCGQPYTTTQTQYDFEYRMRDKKYQAQVWYGPFLLSFESAHPCGLSTVKSSLAVLFSIKLAFIFADCKKSVLSILGAMVPSLGPLGQAHGATR
jgi:hypothetical protein